MKRIIFATLAALTLSLYVLSGTVDLCDDVRYIDWSIEIKSSCKKIIGLNTDTDHLNFGRVSPGSTVERSILVSDSVGSVVKVVARGDAKSWLTIDPSSFTLNSTNTTKVNLIITPPLSASDGKYYGKIAYCFKRP